MQLLPTHKKSFFFYLDSIEMHCACGRCPNSKSALFLADHYTQPPYPWMQPPLTHKSKTHIRDYILPCLHRSALRTSTSPYAQFALSCRSRQPSAPTLMQLPTTHKKKTLDNIIPWRHRNAPHKSKMPECRVCSLSCRSPNPACRCPRWSTWCRDNPCVRKKCEI